MQDTPGIITELCDADYCTKYELARMVRDLFTISDLLEIKGEE
jgi:hypothetical protein